MLLEMYHLTIREKAHQVLTLMKLEDQLAQFVTRTRLQWSHHEMGKIGLHKVGR